MIALIAVSRVGVYDRLPGVDIERFSAAVSGSGLLGYIDNITGGSISNVGVFSLGIIPAINASIFLQIMSITFPSLKKMQREDGPQGRARYQLYTKLAALAFASVQAFGQLSALKCAAPLACACLRCRSSVLSLVSNAHSHDHRRPLPLFAHQYTAAACNRTHVDARWRLQNVRQAARAPANSRRAVQLSSSPLSRPSPGV